MDKLAFTWVCFGCVWVLPGGRRREIKGGCIHIVEHTQYTEKCKGERFDANLDKFLQILVAPLSRI